jgi:hypothetical protein
VAGEPCSITASPFEMGNRAAAHAVVERVPIVWESGTLEDSSEATEDAEESTVKRK